MRYIAFKIAFLHLFLNRMGGSSAVILTGGILFIALLVAYRHLWNARQKLLLSNKALEQKLLLPGNIDSEIRRMGDIIKNISNMVLITDPQNRTAWTNPAVEHFAGLEFNELTAQPVALFFTRVQADNGLVEELIKGVEQRETFSMDLPVLSGTAKPCWLSGDFTPLFSDLDQYTGYMMVFTDISAIKTKEESLLRQNEVLREIAWIESHEVRRPLASILGLIELLPACTGDDEKQEVFEMILSSGGELDGMIRKINERIIEVIV